MLRLIQRGLVLSALSLITSVSSSCECGYSVNATSGSDYATFTDLFETDFLHADNVSGAGWLPQSYNVTPQAARGPYGKQAEVENVVANPLKNKWDWSGASDNGGDAGLQLWVRSQISDGRIPMGEVVTERTDMLYGSYRVGMKLTAVNGTCGAFFWYRNDTQEIDMEFLSKQFNTTSNVVNLVIQTEQSVAAGFNAAGTSDFKVQPLNFSPDDSFHEFRFDFAASHVSFYADGVLMQTLDHDPPDAPGYLVVNHWSNGDPSWSAGPPKEDAVMTVSYVKAYFNTTDEDRMKQYSKQCPTYDPSKVCQIPEQTTAPDPSGNDGNSTAHTYFFSKDPDHAPGQVLYNTSSFAIRSRPSSSLLMKALIVLFTMYVL